ncbi:hypothetical protein [Sphingomonas sp.]|uniref:hypothetical protein n=1 Tax=Sphingomonas sp. TaxID=28214 RepID=UPI0035C797AD
MADIAKIKANVGSMLDQGAPEKDVEDYLASEGVTAQDLRGAKLSPDDERSYAALAADPKTTAADLQGFARSKGMDVTDADAAAFIAARKGGSRVDRKVVYKNLPSAPPASLAQNIGAFAGKFADSVIPGVSRLDRGLHKVAGNAAGALMGCEDFDPSGAFKQGQDEQDYAQALFAEQHPNLDTTAGVAGLAASFALPEARVVRGSGIAPGMANAAINAGGYGALSGAMNDTGDGRLANAGLGALTGAVGGAAVVPAMRAGATVASAARRNIPGVDPTARFLENIPRRLTGRPLAQPGDAATAQAERILGDELPNSTIATGMGTGTRQATPPAVADEVARRQQMGVPAMPADVTEQGRRITGWALQGNGPMATRARNSLMQRQAQQGQRIRSAIVDELGPAVDPIQEAEAITQRARTAADGDYRQAYAQGSPMVITPELREIMGRPAFQRAVPQARENILNRGGDPQAMGFEVLPNGEVTLRQQPTFEAFDQVVRTLNKGIKRSEMTGRPILDNESGAINDVMMDLDGYLKQSNGAYADAKGNFADEMAIKDAMKRGADVSSLTGPEIESQLRTMPQHAQEAWMAGARSQLAADATQAGLKPTANVAQRTRQSLGLSGAGGYAAPGDPGKLQAIETMSGRPGVTNRLDDRLEAEDQAFKTFHEGFGNSKTQPRQAMDEALSGEALNVAAKVGRGDFVGALTSVLFRGNPRGTLRFKRDVQDRIAEIMTATRPNDVQAAMHAIMLRAQTDADFADLLNRAGVGPAKIAAIQAAGQDADPAAEDDANVAPEVPVYSRINP